MNTQNTKHSQAGTSGGIQINPKQPQDKNSPPDVSINTIAEWMRHYPDWQMALIKRCNELENFDLWDLKNRAVTIMDSEHDYTRATRKRVQRALENGNDVATLEAVVLEAERDHTQAAIIPAISNPASRKGIAHV